MRTTAILAITAATLVSNSTVARVKRMPFMPESIWGVWAPSTEVCEKAGNSLITVSARTYTSSEGNCMVVWVSETHARQGPMYSAHLLCSKPGEEAQKTQTDVMFYPKDDKQISTGPRFSELKDYQHCSAGEPSPPKDGRFDGPRADGLRMPSRETRVYSEETP
jgi:hypothetical protein